MYTLGEFLDAKNNNGIEQLWPCVVFDTSVCSKGFMITSKDCQSNNYEITKCRRYTCQLQFRFLRSSLCLALKVYFPYHWSYLNR